MSTGGDVDKWALIRDIGSWFIGLTICMEQALQKVLFDIAADPVIVAMGVAFVTGAASGQITKAIKSRLGESE